MANENALKEDEEDEFDLENCDFDDIDEADTVALKRELFKDLAELDCIDEKKAKIGSPEALGDVLLNTVWEQITNQISLQAGEDFIKANNGLKFDLSEDAHFINPENFEKGELPEHNFENQEKYQKRYEETRADFQTDPDMQIKLTKNMRFNADYKTYERKDAKTGEWVGKIRYKDDLGVWEDFSPRNNKWQKKIAKGARQKFDTRSKYEKGSKKVNKDHVISIAEQIRDSEAAAYMDREERQEFAKSQVNIQDLDSSANQSKSDLSTEEWLSKPRKNGQSQAEYFGIDEDYLKEKDKKARDAYENEKAQAKERAINEGQKSQKKGLFRGNGG